MNVSREPIIGLITDADLNRHVLKTLLTTEHYKVAHCLDAANIHLAKGSIEALDAWLIDVSGSEIDAVIDQLIEQSEVPFLINDHIPPETDLAAYQHWRRRLLQKLQEVAVPIASHQTIVSQQTAKPEKIWLLAASMGGPDAVKRFISHLLADLPIAMVYAQHTESSFDEQLAQSVGKNLAYHTRLIRGDSQLMSGEVAIVPVDKQLRFLPHGRVIETRDPWQGVYQPAIDQVIAELAREYREKLGVIVFSGMCNDGELGCRVAKACGSTVWVQTPESCTSPSMPQAVLATGAVSYQGSPEELAHALTEMMSGSAVAAVLD